MKKLNLIFLVLITLCPAFFANAQTKELKSLKDSAINGDKQAFEKLIKLTKSNKTVKYRQGRHNKKSLKGSLALIALTNLYSFTSKELNDEELKTRKDFRTFFTKNLSKINYSEVFKCWYKSPFETRKVEYKWKPLLPDERLRIKFKEPKLSFLSSKEANMIDSLLKMHNPYVFVELSKCMFRQRDFLLIDNEVLPIVKILTGFDLEVKNDRGQYVDHFDFDYYDIALSNYLSFWIQNYSSFSWNDSTQTFQSFSIKPTENSESEILFDAMTSTNDSIALMAYKSLVNSEIKFDYNFLVHNNVNRSLPTFWYNFMSVIKNIQEYEKTKFLELKLTKEQQILANALLKKTSFKERYQAENLLIEKLDLNTITAFEIFMLYHEQNDEASQSAGRILDKFYSNNWKAITSDDAQLKRYLKKVKQFDDLGIVGLCNNYLYKFEYSSRALLAKLDSIKRTNSDIDIITSIKRVKKKIGSFESKSTLKPAPENQYFNSYNEFVSALAKIHSVPPNDDFSGYSYEYSRLLSKVPYELIDEVIDTLPYLKFRDSFSHWKYGFICIDYGIPVDNIDNSDIRTELKKNLIALNKKELYTHYLRNVGVDIWHSDSTLDFNKVYSVLKYDLANGFVGNNTYRSFGVFGVIKLLEIEFNTRLGYEQISTNYTMSGTANLIQRTYDWRKYLIDHNFVHDDNLPISFLQRHDN